MERSDIIRRMKSKTTTIDLFNYDALTAPPLLSLLTYDDIEYFRRLASSIKYSAKIDYKYAEIDRIMKMRGFVKLGGGTNRVVYRHLEIDTIVIKIAIDNVGIKDNPREYQNQFYLKPYVTKVFEVSPCGTVGLFERCEQIKSREEFMSIASEVYDLLSNWVIGKYVMEDIGSKYFMNYCVRAGFGPVLCDFPYLYELDGNKLYCSIPDEHGILCDGIIDYDEGFNHLYCSKCGVKYKAIELKKAIENKLIINKDKETTKMKIELRLGNKVVKTTDTNKTKKYESPIKRKYKHCVEQTMDVVFENKTTGQSVGDITTKLDDIISDAEKVTDSSVLMDTAESEFINDDTDNVVIDDELEKRRSLLPYETDKVNIMSNEFIDKVRDYLDRDVLLDLTISIRSREGKNIFIEDYIDSEDDQELNNLLGGLVSDVLDYVDEDNHDKVKSIFRSYFKSLRIDDTEEIEEQENIFDEFQLNNDTEPPVGSIQQ